MKRISLMLLFLVGCVSALQAATSTPSNTPSSTATGTSTITPSSTITATSTFTATITRTFTPVLTPTPVASLDGQKGRVVAWPQDVVLSNRVTKPLATPASTPDDPYLLSVQGHTGVAWALSTSVGTVNMQVPGDYKMQPSLWAYASTTVSAGLTATLNLKVDVEVQRMGSAVPVSFYAGTSVNVASVVYPGSLNGSATGAGNCVRLQLPLPGGYAQSVTYAPYTTGLYVPGALKPGDTLAFTISRLSAASGLNLRFIRFDFEYAKNPGLNP